MKKKTLIGSLMLVLAALLWGLSYSIQSLSSNNLETFTIIFFKGFGGFFLVPIALLAKQRFTKPAILGGALIGIVNGIGLILQQIGISNSTVSKSSFISALYLIFVPIIGLFTKKKPKPKFWSAVLLASFGLYLLCMNGDMSINISDLVTLIAAVLFALQIILIDKYVGGVDVLPFVAVQQITTSLISGVLMLVLEKPSLMDIKNMIIPILFMVFGSGLIAQILQNRYQRDVDPTLASILMSLESVFGALGGWLLLNQTLTTREIFGCILIFIAVLIAE